MSCLPECAWSLLVDLFDLERTLNIFGSLRLSGRAHEMFGVPRKLCIWFRRTKPQIPVQAQTHLLEIFMNCDFCFLIPYRSRLWFNSMSACLFNCAIHKLLISYSRSQFKWFRVRWNFELHLHSFPHIYLFHFLFFLIVISFSCVRFTLTRSCERVCSF